MKINVLKPVSTPENLAFGSACLLVASMVLSPFLLSVSMWGLVVAALWQSALTLYREGRAPRMAAAATWIRAVGYSFGRLWRNRPLALLTLLFLTPVISVFWSDDLGYWLRVSRVRLPFLVLPWAFANLPVLPRERYREVLYLLVWFMVLTCIGVGINFMLHYDEVMTGLGRGQPVPVPRQHVRFSLIVATAIIAGAWLWQQRFYLKYSWERTALAAAVAFLFVFLHVLSVRGGLAALYAAMMLALFFYVWRSGKWATGLIAVGLMATLLAVAVNTIPSLQQRLAYMKYDWERYKANEGEAYSDASRWVSLKVGFRLWQENPLLGTGSGDLENEVKRVTETEFPAYRKFPKLPHNQWLHIMASTGLFGLVLSLIGFFGPLASFLNRRHTLLLLFQAMAFVTFIIECTVENAIGVAWYLFYTLWLMHTEE